MNQRFGGGGGMRKTGSIALKGALRKRALCLSARGAYGETCGYRRSGPRRSTAVVSAPRSPSPALFRLRFLFHLTGGREFEAALWHRLRKQRKALSIARTRPSHPHALRKSPRLASPGFTSLFRKTIHISLESVWRINP